MAVRGMEVRLGADSVDVQLTRQVPDGADGRCWEEVSSFRIPDANGDWLDR